jgi:hypothetical protein
MLLSALEGAHASVRFYDTKAQTVGVGYILALNVVLHFGDLLPNHAPLGPLFFAAVWLIVIMPIIQFGQVLYPSRRRADREIVRRRPTPPVTSTSTTSIPTVSPTLANWSNKPSSPRLDVGRGCRASQDLSRQEHQAGALPSRPDDDRRLVRRTRGEQLSRSLAVVGWETRADGDPSRTANNRPDHVGHNQKVPAI